MMIKMEGTKLRLKTTKFLLLEGFENLIKNKLLSIITITTVFVSLSIFSIFLIFSTIINDNIKNIQERVEVVAFLDEGISKEKEEVNNLKEKIENIENIKSVEYISKEDGLEWLNRELIDNEDTEINNIIRNVIDESDNPIPASLSIKTIDPTKNEEVKQELNLFDEIYKVSDTNVVTNFLNNLSKYNKVIFIVIMVVLIFATIMLISNSIRVAVFVRKKEISIIKYIGATNWYIRLPFIIEGLLLGIIGSIVTLVTIGFSYNIANSKLSDFANRLISGFIIPDAKEVMILLIPIIIIFGSIIGICGSIFAVRKHLNV